jgi:hypothetical protein
MKITKKRLQEIVREERMKLLNETPKGCASIGFAGWQPNPNPDFARSYGSDRDARVIGRYRSNNSDLIEQPMPAPSSDPVESAYQELKMSGAYKDLQTELHDSVVAIDNLVAQHSKKMIQADQRSILADLEELSTQMDELRRTFSALR